MTNEEYAMTMPPRQPSSKDAAAQAKALELAREGLAYAMAHHYDPNGTRVWHNIGYLQGTLTQLVSVLESGDATAYLSGFTAAEKADLLVDDARREMARTKP